LSKAHPQDAAPNSKESGRETEKPAAAQISTTAGLKFCEARGFAIRFV